MTQLVWTIERNGTDVTSQIQSMKYSTGRQTQFDSWSPGSLVLSIRNDAGQADAYNLNDTIGIFAYTFEQELFVQEVLYNDLGGAGAGSTATIICTDLLGRIGRTQVFEESLASAATLTQINTEFNGLMPASTTFSLAGGGSSIAAADSSYTGTVLNRLNLNMVTEQGWLALTSNAIWLYGRSDVSALTSTITFARNASGSYQMGYSDIKRIALGQNYLNTCTVIPPVAAQQNSTSSGGVATYGYYGAEFATVDNSATQAKDFAQWQVQSRDDPDELSFQISLSDTANNLDNLMSSIYDTRPVVTVSYKKPGDATTYTSSQIIQGWSMSVTPSATYMDIFTSPLTYTNFFILDDATFGVLNTSRLGW